MRYIFSIFFSLCTLYAVAQQENIWVFGYHAGLNFNGATPTPIQTSIQGFGEGNASVCDANGQLLFYTEGSFVWDRNNNLMPNGSELTGVASATSYSATSSSSQGVLIIPVLGESKKYYIFSLTSMEQNGQNKAGRLYYTVVDMALNGGLGDVVPGQKGIFVDSALSERMASVVGDRCNIWILTCSMDAKFRAYEVTFAGVNKKPVVSGVGMLNEFTGTIAASPDRKKVVATKCFVLGSGSQGAALFDFDAATGVVTNPVQLLSKYGGYGACFSPNSSKLYVSAEFQFLYQYDLSSGNPAAIAASETLIGNAQFTGLKQARDGKIYFKHDDNHIGVINAPDQLGAAAQYQAYAVTLLGGTTIHSGLPNFVPVFSFKKDTVYSSQDVVVRCFGNNTTLQPKDTSGWNYVWIDNTQDKNLYVDKDGSYTVSYYTNSCSYNIDTFKVSFSQIQTRNSCAKGSSGKAWIVKAVGDTTSYSYSWQDASGLVLSSGDTLRNVPSGNYTLHITSASGCNSTLNIFIGKEPDNVSFVVDTLVCINEKIQFQNTSESGFTQFYWSFGDGNTATNNTPEHTYISSGSYKVMLAGAGNYCFDTSYKDIWVDDTFGTAFVINKDSICVGQQVTFTPQLNDERITNWNWHFDDAVNLDRVYTPITRSYDIAGKKEMQMTVSFRACPDKIYKGTVYVSSYPLVNIGPDTSICFDKGAVTLADIQPQPAGSSMMWNTGSTSNNIQVGASGAYSLTVSSSQGCATTDSIVISDDCYLHIPNAFTPNGDGINDYFFPRQELSKGIVDFSMQIFNRWGQVIYETNVLDGRGWDGNFNGAVQPQGIYVYRISARINGFDIKKYEGNITLMR